MESQQQEQQQLLLQPQQQQFTSQPHAAPEQLWRAGVSEPRQEHQVRQESDLGMSHQEHVQLPPPPPQQQDQQQDQQEHQQHWHGHSSDSAGKHHKRQQERHEGSNADKWWLSESEEEGSGDERQMLAEPEDPLYDPDADDADEAWAVQQRSGRATDAILSCPGCFTTLSIDCQQHELYHTQYRAMFTQNCDVKLDQVVHSRVERQQQRSRKRRAAGAATEAAQQGEDVLHPVLCAVCGTQVGAQDADEVVHFYHVLASEC